MTPDGITSLLESWLLDLRAEGKSPETIKSYGNGIKAFVRWAADEDVAPVLDRPTVNTFIANRLDIGQEKSTVLARQLACRRFSAWLAAEGEIDADELATLKPVKLDEKVVDPLSDEHLAALIAACVGRSFWHRRDEALVRVMVEGMLRASEAVGMTIKGTSVRDGVALIHGKGGKERWVPFGTQAARALDRYLRVRRTHRLAETEALWLGDRGKSLGYHGLYCTLVYRAEQAGIEGFHPHRLRHTGTTRWLAAGGSQDGAMAVAGWSRPEMLHRYVKATQTTRAIAEARRLNLGDI